MLNPHAIAEFFNELELVSSDEAANSDLDLLIEAEKRCLLDPVTAALLEEARGRGFTSATRPPPVGSWNVLSFGSTYVSIDNNTADIARSRIREAVEDKLLGGDSTFGGGTLSRATPALVTILPTGLQISSQQTAGAEHSESIAVIVPIADVVQIFSVGSAVNLGVYASHSENDDKPYTLSPASPNNDQHDDGSDDGDDANASGLSARSPTGSTGMRCRCFALRCRDSIQAMEVVTRIEELMRGPQLAVEKPVTSVITIQMEKGGQLGMTLSNVAQETQRGVFITAVEEQSPCARAGIMVGMQIMAVDSVDTSSATHTEVLGAIQNMFDPVSETLTLTVRQDGEFSRRMLQQNRPRVRFNAAHHD
eukprot:m.326014 g.326014  ORF g.326014 m.326014 type:complete len:365 (+) comp20394_c0_seq1:472-1566(+)